MKIKICSPQFYFYKVFYNICFFVFIGKLILKKILYKMDVSKIFSFKKNIF